MFFEIQPIRRVDLKADLRAKLLKLLVAAMTCACLCARAEVPLLKLESAWRYQQTNNLDGQSWQTPAFDDSNWPTGTGLFYVEANSLVSPRRTPLSLGRTTYYFRAGLNFPVEPTNAVITFSNLVDDGAVFYLNGREIQRIRMPSPPSVVLYDTLATETPPGGDATAPDVFAISGEGLTNFVKGTNLLAVEVHQNVLNSDDVVFGAAMSVRLTNSAPEFFQNPASVTVVDGRVGNFIAVVEGDPAPLLQWYKDGTALAGATNATLKIPVVQPLNAGAYQLEATNSFGRVLSSNAFLTVLPDTNPPVVIAAMAEKNLTNVTVTLSEPVTSATLFDNANYAIYQTATPTNRLQIIRIVSTGGSGVVLTTERRAPGINYTLEVKGIRDLSSAGNMIPANSKFPLTYKVDLIAVDGQTLWNYSNGEPMPGTNWAFPDFVHTNWSSGAGVFHAGIPLPNSTDPVRTGLTLNTNAKAFPAYYFRTKFDLPGPVDPSSLRLRDIADDGAVFYLNGYEVFSIGMPSARPVAYQAMASRSVPTPAYEPSIMPSGWTIPGTILLQSGNIFAAEVHQASSGLSDVAFAANLEAVVRSFSPRLCLSVPDFVMEGAGVMTNQGAISISDPLETNLVVALISNDPGSLRVPDQVMIAQGSTLATFDLSVGDNEMVDGPRLVTLTAGSAGIAGIRTIVQVLDKETNALTIILPSRTTETNGTLTGEVRFARPAVVPVTIQLESSLPAEIAVPPTMLMPAGATSAIVEVKITDDLFLDGPASVRISASVAGWVSGTADVLVDDNEAPSLTMELAANIVEGSVATNAGKVYLGGLAVSNVVVSLTSTDPASLSVPATVTILAGKSNALFQITAPDNFLAQSNRVVTVTASTVGLASVSNAVLVVDNDPDHIRFVSVPRYVDTNMQLEFNLVAENADNSVQTNFNMSVTLQAVGLEGPIVIDPTNTVSFSRGWARTSIRLASPGHAARFTCAEYPGESEFFNVGNPIPGANSLRVADIAWHEASQTLFATVPATVSTYSNQLVAIDMNSGQVTHSYPVDANPGQIEISPDGTYLYITTGNGAALQRFDLDTRTTRAKFALGGTAESPRIARDFCIPSGMTDSVVVAAGDYTPYGLSGNTLWRYDHGIAVSLPVFNDAGGYNLESFDSAGGVLLSPPLSCGNAASGSLYYHNNNYLGTSATYRDGRIYDNKGNYYSGQNLALLGSYPDVVDRVYFNYNALAEVDPALRRVFYVAGYFNCGTCIYKLKVYDRDLGQMLLQMQLPGGPGSPWRLIRCGGDRLAYVTADQQLWFIHSDAVQPTGAAAELALAISGVPTNAYLGSNYSFSLTVSNGGPGMASLIRVTNAIPANTTVVESRPSTGSLAIAGGGFDWNLGRLPAGSNATLQITLRFDTAGWQTNTTWALGYEADPVWTNNLVVLPVNVRIAPTATGMFVVNQSSEDLLYDPVRDRLLAAVGGVSAGPSANGLAVFNPYTGLTESFVNLGQRPLTMARSEGGEFLYVSLPDSAIVRRMTLPDLVQDRDFTLGGEDIYGVWYPFYAGDLVTLPNEPDSFVASRFRRPGPMADAHGMGIALFRHGVMKTNVAGGYGSYNLEMDTDTGTVYASDPSTDWPSRQVLLFRCDLTEDGVTQSPSLLPGFSFRGQLVRYAMGRMFTSAGRSARLHPVALDWIYPGSEDGVLVLPDAASGRVFFLTQTGGWQIKSYEIETGRPVGSIPVPNVLGDPGSLVKFGTNGLAFRTSSNQVFLVRTPLLQPSTEADLGISLQGPRTAVKFGEQALFTLSITNCGPATARHITLTNSFSPIVAIEQSACATGSLQTNNGQFVWTLTDLEPGRSSSATVVIRPGQSGLIALAATLGSQTVDTKTGNNSALAMLQVDQDLQMTNVVALPLSLANMVWSPSMGKLLATATTNVPNLAGALLSIDPRDLSVEFKTTLGGDAGCLAQSDDHQMLYVGVDSGVTVLTLPGLAPTNRFLLAPDPSVIPAYAYDLKVVPGANHSVAAVIADRDYAMKWITTYDNGIQRANMDSYYASGAALAFGDDPSILYGLDFSGLGLRRYDVGGTNFNLLDGDSTLFSSYAEMNLVWNKGRLYSSLGNVVDPLNHVVAGAIAGIPQGSRVLYDVQSDRVFYLCPQGSQAVVRAYDGPTLLPVGTRTIPGASGAPVRFVRWGQDGFAFNTANGQLFLFRSGLVATNPAADVSVVLTHSGQPYVAGSNINAAITLTNAGPNAATDVNWTETLPAGARIQNVTCSAGTFVIASNTASGSIPALAAGASALVNVTFVAPASGIVTNQATVLASSTDPAFANNQAVAILWVQAPGGETTMSSLNLPLKDLERDPLRPLLYASLGSGAGALADSVVAIDPINGELGAPVRVGSNPGLLAASPDGRFLYVALDGAGMVQKLSLPGLEKLGSFPVPNNQVVARMAVSPVDAEMVAILRAPDKRLTVHVSGVQRPNEMTDQTMFAFSSSGQLFACNGEFSGVKLNRLDTGANGLQILDSQPGKQTPVNDIKSAGGLLFFNGGMVLDPESKRVRAIMPVPAGSTVEPDAAVGRVYYTTRDPGGWSLRAYDTAQGVEVATLALTGVTNPPVRLLSWGADGLAFFTPNSQITVLRSRLAATNPTVDVALKQTINRVAASTNDTIGIELQLTNRGPVAVSSLVVTQTLSLPVTHVTFTGGPGTAFFTNGAVIWQVGAVPPGLAATLGISLRAMQPGTLTLSAAAQHGLNDLFWGDNTALNTVSVTGSSASNTLQIQFPARDLVYDGARNVMYATTPATNRLGGNLVAVLDPATGALLRAMPAGSDPTHLALSEDGRFLYVALAGGMSVQRYDLQSNLADLWFPLGTGDMYYAHDLKVQPDRPQTVAASLGSPNSSYPFPGALAVYDNGVPRPLRGGPSQCLEFSADGTQLFGYVLWGMGYGFLQMPLGDSGILTSDRHENIQTDPGELRLGGGLLYGGSGQVIDPNLPSVVATVNASGPLAVDERAGCVYYVTKTGTNCELRGFELGSLRALGTQGVANVQGAPARLIRCGSDRLAFLTSSNQLFIVSSPLVVTNPLVSANIGVSQQAFQDFTVSPETLRFQITVTNRGPGPAPNVHVAIKPPLVVGSIALEIARGAMTNVDGNYYCGLGTLAAGGSVSLTLSAIITNTMVQSNLVSVSAGAPDPAPEDNVSMVQCQGLFFQRPNSLQTASANTRALAYDPVRHRLLASLSPIGTTNQIGWFDPETGLLLGTRAVELAATSMAITDDGLYCYLSSKTTGLVQRIHLPSMTPDLSFRPLESTMTLSMATIPGNSHALAATCVVTNTLVTAVFDDGVARSETVIGRTFTLLSCSADAANLYGYDNGGNNSPHLFRMALTGSGVNLLDNAPPDMPYGLNNDMLFAADRLIFANGNVVNPTTWSEETGFAPGNWGNSLVWIPAIGGVAFMVPFAYNDPVRILVYTMASREQLADMNFGSIYNGFGSLTYCGADRFAFRSGDKIYFRRSDSIPAADIVLSCSASTNRVAEGKTVLVELSVSNASPYTVSGVVLTNSLPAGFDVVSATASQGVLSTNGQRIMASIGTLKNGAAATVSLVLTATGTAFVTVTNSADAAGGDLEDPILFNNHVDRQFIIAPRDIDGDGMPDAWELAHGLDPHDAQDALHDSDGDGLTNLQEYLAGENPNEFNPVRIVSAQVNRVGELELLVQAPGLVGYCLQNSTNLVDWQTVSTFTGQADRQVLRAPFSLSVSGTFYRLQRTNTSSK